MVIVMYATAIQEAVAKGDIAQMKEVLKEAHKHVEEYGNVPMAIEILKHEIAKEEARLRGDRK